MAGSALLEGIETARARYVDDDLHGALDELARLRGTGDLAEGLTAGPTGDEALLARHHRLYLEYRHAYLLDRTGDLRGALDAAGGAADRARSLERGCPGAGLACFRVHLLRLALLASELEHRGGRDESAARRLVDALTVDLGFDPDDEHLAHRGLAAATAAAANQLDELARRIGGAPVASLLEGVAETRAAAGIPDDWLPIDQLEPVAVDGAAATGGERTTGFAYPSWTSEVSRVSALAAAEARREVRDAIGHLDRPEVAALSDRAVAAAESHLATLPRCVAADVQLVLAMGPRCLASSVAGRLDDALDGCEALHAAARRLHAEHPGELLVLRSAAIATRGVASAAAGTARRDTATRVRASTLLKAAMGLEHAVIDAIGPDAGSVLSLARLASTLDRVSAHRRFRDVPVHRYRSVLLYDAALRVDPANPAARRELDALMEDHRPLDAARATAAEPGFAAELAAWSWPPFFSGLTASPPASSPQGAASGRVADVR